MSSKSKDTVTAAAVPVVRAMRGDDMKFDVRTLKYRLRRTELSQKEIQAHLDSLPDEAAECESTHTQFIATFEGRNYRH